MKERMEHVFIRQDGTLSCTHCGDKYRMALPCPVDVYTAAMKAWGVLHEGCPPPPPKEADAYASLKMAELALSQIGGNE